MAVCLKNNFLQSRCRQSASRSYLIWCELFWPITKCVWSNYFVYTCAIQLKNRLHCNAGGTKEGYYTATSTWFPAVCRGN